LRAGDTLVAGSLNRIGRIWTLGRENLGPEELMAIEVPILPLVTQQALDGRQAEVGALQAKHTAISQANAAMLERVHARNL
jgi:hypothetical protein